jgi:flagellar hook-basal body complex protein FliE
MAAIVPIQSVPIQSIDPQSIRMPGSGAASPSAETGSMFQGMFQTAVNTVEGMQAKADSTVQSFLSGENEDVHSSVLAVQQASLSFSLFQQVRNRVVSAYQEVMKMQV